MVEIQQEHRMIESLMSEEDKLVEEIAMPCDKCRQIVIGIQEGTARAISDGSFKDGICTSAGLIFGHEGDNDLLETVNRERRHEH